MISPRRKRDILIPSDHQCSQGYYHPRALSHWNMKVDCKSVFRELLHLLKPDSATAQMPVVLPGRCKVRHCFSVGRLLLSKLSCAFIGPREKPHESMSSTHGKALQYSSSQHQLLLSLLRTYDVVSVERGLAEWQDNVQGAHKATVRCREQSMDRAPGHWLGGTMVTLEARVVQGSSTDVEITNSMCF